MKAISEAFVDFFKFTKKSSANVYRQYRQESRAVARKPRDAAAVLFRLKFADDIHYKFKSSQASKALNIPAQNII